MESDSVYQFPRNVHLQVIEHIFFHLFLVFFNSKRPHVRALHQDKIFSYIVISCIFIIGFDMLSVYANGQPAAFFRVLNYSSGVITRIIDILPPILWLVYVCFQIFKDARMLRSLKAPLFAAFTLNAVFVCSSLVTGWVFHIDDTNQFVIGPYSFARVIFVMSFFVIATVLAVLYRKRLEKGIYFGLICFVIPVSVGVAAQIFVDTTVFVGIGMSISVLTVFFNIQNKHLTTDYLTGIYNRRQLDHYLAQKIKRGDNRPFGAILIDLDGFKTINDTYGHHAGDIVLQTAVSLIGDCIRKEGFFARYGGDEFCVVMDTAEKAFLEQKASSIRHRIRAHNQMSEKSLQLKLSMGYDLYNDRLGACPQDFLVHIDKLMYENKKQD